MPDRLVFSRVVLDHLEDFGFGGGIEWLFDKLDLTEGTDFERELLGACTNVKPGEDDPAETYFLERVTVDVVDRLAEADPDDAGDATELLACTCPAFRYQQIPKPAHVRQGVVTFDNIGECKHLAEYRKRTRSHAARDDAQQGLDDMLGGGGT